MAGIKKTAPRTSSRDCLTGSNLDLREPAGHCYKGKTRLKAAGRSDGPIKGTQPTRVFRPGWKDELSALWSCGIRTIANDRLPAIIREKTQDLFDC